ncbi:MAG: MATE family efflux transporter [Paludibacter sp.]|jgi:putative MATE family efflux protein|nr:MATE family efflux transporter [Paludibacter sp.]MBP8782710.1 MATE family efflux transporter [Paludibacter sp.]MDX9919524.1 MATE family efflux transporter [Paludibacter sp.]
MSQTISSTNKLATENIGKLMWEYTLPAILGTVVMSLYNIVDRIFIGQGVGALAISGLALTMPFSIVLMAFGMLIGAGSASRISITLGENNKDKAEKILGNAITLTFIMSGTAILLSMIFMDDILRLFGGTDNTLQYAREYMMIIIPGGIFTALYFGMNNILRASGHPKKAMQNIMLGAIINTVLDPIFIFVFDWGIQGAAWATVISYLIGTIHVGRQFFGKNSTLRFHWNNLKPQKDIILSIVSIGMSPFSMQIGTSMVVIFINSTLLKYGGDLAIGAYGIINSINMLIVMFIVGLNQGTQPIVGFNYGAGNYSRMFTTIKKAVIVATCFSVFGFILGIIFPRMAVSLFTNDINMIDISANAMRISVIMFPVIGIQIVISNFFQSIGKAKISIFLSLTRQFIFFIPALFILPPLFKLNGAWASMPVSDGLAFFVSISTFALFYKKFKQTKMQASDLPAEIIEQ